MIIKKISIENYLCYYDVKEFDLSEGLNIILGENGEGKTKFYEALVWLFGGSDEDLHLLVSAKKLDETEIGGSFRVKVSMIAEQNDERKTVSKSFLVKKIKANECSISNFMIEGIEENKSGERNQVDGKRLLDNIFPFQIRRYSMFKGEAELDIFKSEDALPNLINLFSDAKHYDKYSEKGAFLKEKAEKVVEETTRNDRKNEALYKKLELEIKQLDDERYKIQVHLDATENEIRKLEGELQAAESHVKNAEALATINRRIQNVEEKISDMKKKIDENYTTNLFDENWIAVNFETIHHEFAKKINLLSEEKRKQQSEFDRQKGIKEGERKARAELELLNNALPLPIGIPSKAHMEEMLRDKICKVCNTKAPIGSDPYKFMMKRLQEYLTTQAEIFKPEEEGNAGKELFEKNYTNRLVNLSVSHEDNLKNLRGIRTRIQELFKFNDARRNDIEELQVQLEREKMEREKILGNSMIAEEKLGNVLKNYNAWQNDLKQRYREQTDYEARLKIVLADLKAKKTEKDNIDLKSASSFLIKTREILRDIELIFSETKEIKFDEFIKKLQTKSNSYFNRINIGSFTGTIVFIKRVKAGKNIVDIELQEDGKTFYKPGQALETSKYIAVLFAISELASETREENYPMIFDAPTSSFGENKTAEFLNLIYETHNQKILLIKDFLATDKKSKLLEVKKDFEYVKRNKAFWVKLERPFDPNTLKTINTQVINL